MNEHHVNETFTTQDIYALARNKKTTYMYKCIMYFHMLGFSKQEIMDLFDMSRQSYSQCLSRNRKTGVNETFTDTSVNETFTDSEQNVPSDKQSEQNVPVDFKSFGYYLEPIVLGGDEQ